MRSRAMMAPLNSKDILVLAMKLQKFEISLQLRELGI